MVWKFFDNFRYQADIDADGCDDVALAQSISRYLFTVDGGNVGKGYFVWGGFWLFAEPSTESGTCCSIVSDVGSGINLGIQR